MDVPAELKLQPGDTVLFKGGVHYLGNLKLSGLAGTVYVIFNAYVGVEDVTWFLSGETVFMSLLGGTGVFWGPLVGAFVYIMLKWWISGYVYHWPLVVGALFAVIVLWFPQGILGTTLDLWRRKFGT